ncbi:MAG TPA: hypothetical protein VLI92_00205 [Candidatus Saccharimonadales bacterium]|nr:hypothetical protein [Candidatus Saccharimonadales bacterium]
MKKFLLITLVTALYLFAMLHFAAIYFADINNTSAQSLLSQGDYQSALVQATQAIEKNPQEPLYYRGRAKVWIAQLSTADETQRQIIKRLALKDLQDAYNLNPKNLATIRNEVVLYFFLANGDLNIPTGLSNLDSAYLKIAQDFYRKVQNISPNDVGIYVLLARYEKRLGLTEDYNKNVEVVKRLRPDLLEWNDAFK